MEYIDDYFKSSPGDEQKQEFEQRIINDVSFAGEVAFYISANGAIKEQMQEEKKQRFRQIYYEQKVIPITKRPVRKLMQYMAAASVIAAVVLLTWFLTGSKTSPQQLADQYIQQNFQTLSVKMGSPDSLQTGLRLFNQDKLTEALNQFEGILKNDPTNDEAKKYAGIVSLRLTQYDKALGYFSSLASETLEINPGKLYVAITLLKRNQTGDVATAKKLLQEIKEEDLEGKADAEKLSEKL
ncbi:MAG: hypothetical protein ABI707_07995 [Ferruginibacter sp.]